jgi:flavin reductase (DIM6/NTAB) family NADH-FMN oxidoreductase RutF
MSLTPFERARGFVEIDILEEATTFFRGMREVDAGALLTSVDAKGKPNPMAVGWLTLGPGWSAPPACVALVRPATYTYKCLEHTGDYTICLPYPHQRGAARFCGTESGRDWDKFAECDFTPLPSTKITSPGIAECGLVLECQVVQKNDLRADTYADHIWHPPQDEIHRAYYAEILRALAQVKFLEMFGEE